MTSFDFVRHEIRLNAKIDRGDGAEIRILIRGGFIFRPSGHHKAQGVRGRTGKCRILKEVGYGEDGSQEGQDRQSPKMWWRGKRRVLGVFIGHIERGEGTPFSCNEAAVSAIIVFKPEAGSYCVL